MSLALLAPVNWTMQYWSLPGRPWEQEAGKMLLQKWSTRSMMALMPLILNWINFISYMTIQSKTNVLEIKVFNFVIPGQVVKNGFGGLVWLKFWHWGTGHSLFVVWMSLQQPNVLFDRATLPKPKSSFRDKISNIMVAWQHAFPNAENLFKIQ